MTGFRTLTAIENLSQAVSRSAEGRCSLLWAFCDRVRKLPEIQHPVRSVSHLGIFGARIDFEASDWKWLADDSASLQAESDAELAAHAVLRLWREAGEPLAAASSWKQQQQRIATTQSRAASASCGYFDCPSQEHLAVWNLRHP